VLQPSLISYTSSLTTTLLVRAVKTASLLSISSAAPGENDVFEAVCLWLPMFYACYCYSVFCAC